jgi:hypothetical protein
MAATTPQSFRVLRPSGTSRENDAVTVTPG